MDDNPYLGWGLRSVELADQAVLNPYFASLAEPLSDYTFSQLFTWRNSLRVLWKIIDSHLCVFANGAGDLTLLMPPIGDTSSDRALKSAFDLMDEFNAAHNVPDRTRIEYASEELLGRFERGGLLVRPMGADYLYDTQRMIDLAGGDLSSKRQAKNRFLRNYEHRVETYDAARHRDDCVKLLDTWKIHQDAQHLDEANSNAIKRSKESIATALCLDWAQTLGLKGMVVYVKALAGEPDANTPTSGSDSHSLNSGLPPLTSNAWSLRAFTFGEQLGVSQSSITIEKTDLAVKGLAQFIFSDFVAKNWSQFPVVNVGDDWGLETLAWTKQSYRPVKMLHKFVMRREAAAMSATGIELSQTPAVAAAAPAVESPAAVEVPVAIRTARKGDLSATLQLEQATFTSHAISKRQMGYLQQRQSAIFLVAEQGDRVVGDGIALVRHHRTGRTGRIYSLVVQPEARGRKIGQQLLRKLVDELSIRGVNRVYLEVQEGNSAAIRLYEQFGFRRIRVLPAYYGEGTDGLHMVYKTAGAEDAPLFRGVA